MTSKKLSNIFINKSELFLLYNNYNCKIIQKAFISDRIINRQECNHQ